MDSQVLTVVASGVERLQSLGHRVEETDVRVEGWQEIFRVLVLADERRYRGHLLDAGSSQLTDDEARTLEVAVRVGGDEETTARRSLQSYCQRIGQELDGFDIIVTPPTAVPAFPVGQRPQVIDGTAVDGLWGAFPFCVPFNVAGWPAASLPCGLAEGLPVGIQIIARPGQEQLLLDVCQDLEEAIGFEDAPVCRRWQQVPKE